ncbi:MAG: twin-arginine translocation signal domain-containing protein, partial [Candidatus Aminicenantes bacterium]|nr:twin-arginine translocation signal domain-containing protein [Candidatus Aminicenantes bacterium]
MSPINRREFLTRMAAGTGALAGAKKATGA